MKWQEKLLMKTDTGFDSILGVPQISLFGNARITIDGYKSIVEYSENSITLDCGKYALEIAGSSLTIESFTSISFTAVGKIESVSFRG